MSGCKKAFDEVQADLKAIGDDIGVEIKAQRSEIFDMMHRI
jgi:ACT domain-containing protein